jgi:hypothetical protein
MSGILPENPVVGIHTPWPEQSEQIKKIITNVQLYQYFLSDWNILENKFKKHDMFCFQNVFHYINDPMKAFKNVLASCNYLLIQDRIIRNRGKNGEIFCDDGDCMRYRIGQVISNFEDAFDLLALKNKIIFCYPYLDKGNVHVIALLKSR